MSSANTRYSARFQLPDLLERGRDELISCPVYRSGALVAPTALGSTVTVRSRSGTIVNAAAVTVTGSIAQYTIPAASLPSTLPYEAGWLFEWLLVMPDVTHRFRNTGALVRNRLYPCITDLDIARRLRSLDLTHAAKLTDRTDLQDAIDEADVELQLELLKDHRRPNLVAEPTALRMAWLNLAVAILLEDEATRDNAYAEAARDWRKRYESAYAEAAPGFDYDEDGQVDDPQQGDAVEDGLIWTC